MKLPTVISFLSLALLGAFQVGEVSSSKILMVTFFTSKSHKITYESLLRELARRGHEVTLLSPISSPNETNFRNLPMLDFDTLLKNTPNLFELKLSSNPLINEFLFNPYLFFGAIMPDICRRSYQLPVIQEVLKEKWDLIFVSPFVNECVLGLFHKIGAPMVAFQQTEIFPQNADVLGTPSPPSFVSSILIGYTDRMNFRERLVNLIKSVVNWAILELYYYPLVTEVYREHFKDPSIPPVKEILKNTSLLLVNSHISFAKPRPYMPDIIEVGGLHLFPAKPVPKDLKEFFDGAKDGFILFTMGSSLQGSQMPEGHRQIFLNTFRKLKQRVIWKWETEKMEGLPPNVKLSKWLPQQDVLGHKNIRLFITHGGMGGTAEAIYHGVPLLGIPMFGDQEANLLKAESYGFAQQLDFKTLTEEKLMAGIKTVLDDPKYRDSAKHLSKIYLDQPDKPMDRAIFWIEYVIRHKGAPHLRSAARDLNYIQYFSLDVLAVLAIIGLVSLKINILIFKAIFRKCFGSKQAKNVDKNKKTK